MENFSLDQQSMVVLDRWPLNLRVAKDRCLLLHFYRVMVSRTEVGLEAQGEQ